VKLLLDTHVWLDALRAPNRLSRATRREIYNPKNELYLSPLSIWEAGLLVRRGKIRIGSTFTGWVRESLQQLVVLEAPITFSVVAEASGIQLPQPDFGDVFLAATAFVFGLTLVTADTQLLQCSWRKTFPDR
jgi:PIN domain nuclease of toxin-antitoxin system